MLSTITSAYIALWTLLVLSGHTALSQERIIVYPQPESEQDQRTIYPVKLLNLALHKTGVPFRLQPSEERMPQGRALLMLTQDQIVHVVWSMTSIEREAELLPIRIPIYKGLIGWRLLLIKAQDQDKFRHIQAVKDLQQLKVGQGHDWPDTAILRHNGFQVTGVANYESLFDMLQKGRIDFFPRSIVEIWAEAEAHQHQRLVVAPTLALQYPTAFYFFVNKQNAPLAQLIEDGLNQAIKDGSFNQLFDEYHQSLLQRAQLPSRQVFALDNPILPQNTPLQRQELWYKRQ